MKGVRCLLLFCFACCAATKSHSQAVSPMNALQLASYSVFSGDVNGDGQTDILAKSKPKFVPILLDDISIPIAAFSSPNFLLLSNGGAYSLVLKPSGSILSSAVWQANTHVVALGDFLGNGVMSMMIRSQIPGGDTFTVTTPASAVQPTLLQRISPNDLGVDLGASARTVDFRDANRDGRADLVVRTNGRITDVILADVNGLFIRATGNASIEATWYGLRAALDDNDPQSALNFITLTRQNQYGAAFQAAGSQLSGLTQKWSAFAAVRVVPASFANYLITQTIDGVATDYMITFIWENGRWVVAEL